MGPRYSVVLSLLLLLCIQQYVLSGQVTKISIQKRQPARKASSSSANDGDSVHLLNYLDAQVLAVAACMERMATLHTAPPHVPPDLTVSNSMQPHAQGLCRFASCRFPAPICLDVRVTSQEHVRVQLSWNAACPVARHGTGTRFHHAVA